ncbi:hypothetical protein MMC10_005077 [Thelotrema lepadinum]|nr:hypothetical protein [Thelotrema lepadinum]
MSPRVDEFVHIGPRASLYTPAKSSPGQLVVICTWLGAARKHITKYTTLYQRIAPGARILLIESNVPILVSAYARQRSLIQCAVSAVLDTLSECGFLDESHTSSKEGLSTPAEESHPDHVDVATSRKSSPKIVLHTFSNGGTNTVTQLLIELRKRLPCSIPISGIVMDSCPAKGTYWRSYNAMVLSLPPGVATRLAGAVAVHFLLVLLYTWIAWGNENPASLMRRTLLDEHTLCNAVDGTKRGRNTEITSGPISDEETHERAQDDVTANATGHLCYLYSKEDRMVDWTDISDHAEDARHKGGWRVAEIVFDGSAHCAHMSQFEDQYVSAVEAMWEGSPKVEMNGTKKDAVSAKL